MGLPSIRKPTLALQAEWLSQCYGGYPSYGRISVHTSCDYVRKDWRLRTAEVMAREKLYREGYTQRAFRVMRMTSFVFDER